MMTYVPRTINQEYTKIAARNKMFSGGCGDISLTLYDADTNKEVKTEFSMDLNGLFGRNDNNLGTYKMYIIA